MQAQGEVTVTGTGTTTDMGEVVEEEMNMITVGGIEMVIGTGTMIHMAGIGSETEMDLVTGMVRKNVKLMDLREVIGMVQKEVMSMAQREVIVTISMRAVLQVTATEVTKTTTVFLPGDLELLL